jgi:ComF family protein
MQWLRELAREAWQGALELLLPLACAECRRELDPDDENALCASCRAGFVPVAGDLRGRAPVPLAACHAGTSYAGAAERWIQRFKYPERGLAGLDPGAPAVARWLLRRAADEALAAGAELPELVVPIPLHPRRLRERGFNPAGLIARSLAHAHRVRFDAVALVRVRDTPSQASLGRRERSRNVRDAFRARRSTDVPARVWLVDDVVTTGATLASAARALRRSGAKEVIALCAARTPAPADSDART